MTDEIVDEKWISVRKAALIYGCNDGTLWEMIKKCRPGNTLEPSDIKEEDGKTLIRRAWAEDGFPLHRNNNKVELEVLDEGAKNE